MPCTSSADAALGKVREGKTLDRDELFALQVAAEFDLTQPGSWEGSPKRMPRLHSLAAIETLNQKKLELEEAKVAEQEVRWELTRLKREIEQERRRSAVRQVEEQRRINAESQRHFMKELTGRALAEALLVNEPADEEEVVMLARMLHLRMDELFDDLRERSGFKLFKLMDQDGSGLVSYVDFERLVREDMLINADEFSHEELKRVWVWIDYEASGGVNMGEFAAFMRKGEMNDSLTWRDRQWLRHKAQADEVRRLKQEQTPGYTQALAVAEPASEEEVLMLAQRLNIALNNDEVSGWYGLFKRISTGASNKITLYQLARCMRLDYFISPAEFSDWDLLRVWKVLDTKGSGFLSAGEFGAFMRLGESERTGPTWQEKVAAAKREQGDKVRAELSEMMQRDVVRNLGDVAKASPSDLLDFARLLNARARQLVPELELVDDPTLCAWWRLFKEMDVDGSEMMGLLTFSRLVRERLKLSTQIVPDHTLHAVWLAIDVEGAGLISKSAFGAFMRLGGESKQRPWKDRLAEFKKATADEVRAQLSATPNRGIGRLIDDEPLGLEALKALSVRLNEQMAELMPAGASWFTLFKLAGEDTMGRVTYDELVGMVRDVLMLGPTAVSDSELRGLWAALDVERAGTINYGDFGAFMRRGARAREGLSWRERVSLVNKAKSDQVRKQLDGLSGRSQARLIAGEHRASAEQVRDVSLRLNAQLHAMVRDPRARAPTRLFKGMDTSDSGRIGFSNFTKMVREVLQVPATGACGISKSELRSVWLALDRESSGYIINGEFVAFMRLGASAIPKLGIVEQRQERATNARAELDGMRAKELAAQTRELNVGTIAKTEELMLLRAELDALKSGSSATSTNSTASLPRIATSHEARLQSYATRTPRSSRGFAINSSRRSPSKNLRHTLQMSISTEAEAVS